MKKVSIIIPVYNSEKYLCQCLESILNQTHKNFEVLLVCDKGKDNSDKICLEYAEKHHNIYTFIREKGLGVSSARNYALDNISKDSEYVSFIDADDWIEPTFLETLIDNIEQHKADLSYCKHKSSKPTKKQFQSIKIVETKIFTANQCIKQLISKENATFCVWNKLFKKDLLDDIRFDETIKFAEDILFCFKYLLKCKSIVSTNQKLYHYINNPTSAIHNCHALQRMSEIETYEQISQMAGGFSQTAKIYMRTWQYIMMVEKLWLYKKSKLKLSELKNKLINAINDNKPFFKATKKHLVFYRQLTSFLEKIIGK